MCQAVARGSGCSVLSCWPCYCYGCQTSWPLSHLVWAPGFSILRSASCSDMLYVTHTATHHVNRFYSIFLKGNECCVQYAKAQGQGGRRQAAAGHGANGPSRPIADTAGRGMESSGDGRPRHELDGSTADHLVGREVLESSAEVRLEASTAKRCGGGSGDRRLL